MYTLSQGHYLIGLIYASFLIRQSAQNININRLYFYLHKTSSVEVTASAWLLSSLTFSVTLFSSRRSPHMTIPRRSFSNDTVTALRTWLLICARGIAVHKLSNPEET